MSDSIPAPFAHLIPEGYPLDALFPPYLNEGSYGPAVVYLRGLVATFAKSPFGLSDPLYDDGLVECLKYLQSWELEFTGDDVDGRFGQGTRAAFLRVCRVDVHTLKCNVFGVGLGPTMWAGPDHEGLLPWPLSADVLDFRSVGIVTLKVRTGISLVRDFNDVPTLKKHLADRKGGVDDELSHDGGKTWTRIGDIPDLDQHFVGVWQAAYAAKTPAA